MHNTNKKDNSSNKTHSNASLLYRKHKLRQEGISTSKVLMALMLEVQCHRAASLASLGGDLFFENRLWSIQKAVARQLNALDDMPLALITTQEKRSLHGEWVTIRSQWQKDSTMQNFLLHSHLIEYILKLNISVAERAGHTHLMDGHAALTDYSMRHLPQLIETSAQARGLATHCAAMQHNPSAVTSRIRFLIDEIQQRNDQAQNAIADCSTRCYNAIQQARSNNQCQTYMQTFLTRLNDHFTDGEQPKVLSDEIYTTGSHFIMSTYDVLLRVYKMMSKSMDTEMHEWVSRSSYHS